jgi:cytochrome c peroxidase
MWWGGCLSGIGVLIAIAGCGRWSDRLACGDDGCLWTRDEWARVTSLAGLPDRVPPPDPSNQYLLVPGAAELGHKLYFDTRLSGTASWIDSLGRPAPNARAENKGDPINISCATCHDPARFGSDFTSTPGNVSIGAGWYDVNAQQTLNAAFFSLLYWNGRTDAVWAQAAQVIESVVSMNGDRMNTLRVVATNYRNEYAAIFCANPDSTDPGCPLPAPDQLGTADRALATRVHVNASKAIAAYEWLLRSGESAFDRYAKAGPGSGELTPAAERGLKLFIGRASCIDCHNTSLLSDQEFHNIGITQQGTPVPTVAECSGTSSCDCTGANDKTCLPWGAYGGALKRAVPPEFSRQSEYSDDISSVASPASGRCDVSSSGSDGGLAPPERCKGAWRTPSLRDVAMTAPYMHDGVFATLSDVIWHYDQADGAGSELAPLNLSHQERADLVAFLESLTGAPGPPDLVGPPDLSGVSDAPPPPDGGADGPQNLTAPAEGDR